MLIVQQKKIKRVLTERQILATADHPIIVTLHYCFQGNDHIYFVMDYCGGGEFFSILKKMPNKCLPEKSVRFYCAEVLIALEYLHIMGFIYRGFFFRSHSLSISSALTPFFLVTDLKPENILMHASGHLMLTDFDLSKQSDHPVKPKVIKSFFAEDVIDTKPEVVTNSFVGTAEYIAPEVIEGFGHTSAVDWWTFGILTYEMLYGKAPFKGQTRKEIFNKILHSKLSFPEEISVSKDGKNMIKRLLAGDPHKRLGSEHGAADLKAHPFFKQINWALVRDSPPPFVPDTPDLFATYGDEDKEDENVHDFDDFKFDETENSGLDCCNYPKKKPTTTLLFS